MASRPRIAKEVGVSRGEAIDRYSTVEYKQRYSGQEYTGGGTMQAVAPGQLVIRQGTEVDVDHLRGVIARANDQFRGLVSDGLFAAYLASAMDVEHRLEDGELLAAELEGTIVGTITFYRDSSDEGMPIRFPDSTAGIRATAVDPSARGLGIGRALVDACIARAAAAGASSVGLHTARFMNAAVTVYERCGFNRVPTYDFEWSQFFPGSPSEVEPALAYLLDLR
jgi:GNAT superfamily N-acetyltransferase